MKKSVVVTGGAGFVGSNLIESLLLKTNYNINEIKDLLSAEGETKIDLVINNKNKKAHFSLQMNRKFDLNHLKALKAKNYVEKITV